MNAYLLRLKGKERCYNAESHDYENFYEVEVLGHAKGDTARATAVSGGMAKDSQRLQPELHAGMAGSEARQKKPL